MKYSLSALTLVLLLLISAATGALLTNLTIASSPEQGTISIEASTMYGENVYTLIEVDDGDNDEEDVITERLHEFTLEVENAEGIVIWDFNDGTTATGAMVSHSFEQPGRYLVTATSTNQERSETTSIELTVGVVGQVESDNMECVCAPTAKDTVVNLVPALGVVSFSGVVNVEQMGAVNLAPFATRFKNVIFGCCWNEPWTDLLLNNQFCTTTRSVPMTSISHLISLMRNLCPVRAYNFA